MRFAFGRVAPCLLRMLSRKIVSRRKKSEQKCGFLVTSKKCFNQLLACSRLLGSLRIHKYCMFHRLPVQRLLSATSTCREQILIVRGISTSWRVLEQGGWISERGRLRDDPYIIAKATPAPRPRPSHLATTVDPLSSSSNRRGEQAERPARGIGVGGVRHSNSWQDASANTEQSRIEDENDGPRSSRGAAGSRHPPAASQHGHAVRPGASNENGQRRDHRRSHQKESGDRHPAGTAAGGSRRVQPASMSERGREDTPARGNFGFLATPSAKVVEINDTGDKVKCPVCQRGMDHWKSGQRQQVRNGDIAFFWPPSRSIRSFRCERGAVQMLFLLSGMPLKLHRTRYHVCTW